MVTPSLEWRCNYTMHCIISYQVQLRIMNHGSAESLMICITKLNYFILILVIEVFESSCGYFLLLPLTDFISFFSQRTPLLLVTSAVEAPSLQKHTLRKIESPQGSLCSHCLGSL